MPFRYQIRGRRGAKVPYVLTYDPAAGKAAPRERRPGRSNVKLTGAQNK